MPPQSMPLWHKDYFELKATGNKQLQDKFSAFYLLLKAGHECVKLGLSPLYQEGQKLTTRQLGTLISPGTAPEESA